MTGITLAKWQGSDFNQLDAHVAETGVVRADLAQEKFLPVLDSALAFAVTAPCEIFEHVVRLFNLGDHFL